MPRPGKITPATVPQIGIWLEQGFDAKEIAAKLGCTIGTLRVRCSHLGVSLRRRGTPPRKVAEGAERPTAAAWEERIVQRAVDAVLNEIQARDANRTGEGYPVVEAPSLEPHHFSLCRNSLPRNKPHSSPRAPKSVRAERLEHVVITLPEGAAQQLTARAVAKGVSGAMFASTLLQTVVQDDLFEAVLDESA
jgi:hypothetical protein